MRSVLSILIVVSSLACVACSYSTDFVVINASESPVDISYKVSAHGQGVRVPEHAKAEQALQEACPGLTWRHEQSIDLDCDGRRDEVFTAQDDTQYYVAAVAPRQDSFCGPPEPLRPESLNQNPREALGATPEGFRRSARCKGLNLVAGECDSFHLYWNHAAGKLDWWRL
jgi:hypothetical protein